MAFHAPTLEEHLARYGFALWHVKHRNVLDVACGDGHGTILLGYGAKTLTGVDIDSKRLKKAASRQYECPTFWHKVDVEKHPLPFKDGSFHVVVSFETFEHLEDPDVLLKEIVRVLGPGGVLVFSVPHMVKNREHKVLFDEAKARAFISARMLLKELHVFDKRPITGKPCWANVVDYVGVAQKR